jgi:glycosidase
MPDFSHNCWWRDGVIYQVYPRSFKDTTGNGVGDLQGIIENLDHLVDLGVDALWISPFFPSPMADFGYDVSDYTDVHPLFGTLETMERLIEAAHDRRLRVVLDFVPNHSSDQHPWFIESRSSRDNPKRDWYVWRDAKPDGSAPNNWLSVFGGSAWEWDAATGQYYLHSFLNEQPDLNWRHEGVKAAMFDVLRFWLDRGVDGFRIDVAHYIMKDPEFRDNPARPESPEDFFKPMGEYATQDHLYDKGHPDVHGVFQEMRTLADSYNAIGERFLAGEIHIFDVAEWAAYYGRAGDELHFPLNFGLIKAGWTAEAIRRSVDALEATIREGDWPNYVLGNHDEPRLATRYGEVQARVAAMLLLTLRGTPTLYYGDEIGMLDVAIPPDRIQDPWPLRSGILEINRDPCRTPMQWTGGPGAGFSPAAAEGSVPEPWLPVHPNHTHVNVEHQQADPGSIYNFYRRLLRLRRDTPALVRGSYRPIESPAGTFVYLRELDDARRLVALNFTDEPKLIRIPTDLAGRLEISTEMDRAGESVAGGVLALRRHEACLLS